MYGVPKYQRRFRSVAFYLLMSMYSSCLSILIVRPCILTVVYIYLLLSTYS